MCNGCLPVSLSIPVCLSDTAMPLTGYIGGEAQMTCLYGTGHEKVGKYLQNVGSPTSLIHTEHGQVKTSNGKFSLYDDTRTRELTVTFRQLEAEDSGNYTCGIKDTGPYLVWPLVVQRCKLSFCIFQMNGFICVILTLISPNIWYLFRWVVRLGQYHVKL